MGRIVGINTLIFTQSGGSEGIGFAIPNNVVEKVYHQLRTDGAFAVALLEWFRKTLLRCWLRRESHAFRWSFPMSRREAPPGV